MKGQREDGKKAERRHRRFLLCFRPSAIATDSPKVVAGRPASTDPALNAFGYFSNEETSSPKRKKKQQSASEDLNEGRRRKFRALSGIKAAIFGSSKGGSRSGKVQQDPSRSSDTSENISQEAVPAEIRQEQSPKSTDSVTHKTDSNSGTTSSSSSCSVFGASKTSSCSSRRKLDSPTSSAESQDSVRSPSPQPSRRKTPSSMRLPAPTSRRGLDPIIGFCYLLAISLLTTLIWGQIPAVICTSIWLYFFGRTRGRRRADGEQNACRTHRTSNRGTTINGSSWRASSIGATTTTTNIGPQVQSTRWTSGRRYILIGRTNRAISG